MLSFSQVPVVTPIRYGVGVGHLARNDSVFLTTFESLIYTNNNSVYYALTPRTWDDDME